MAITLNTNNLTPFSIGARLRVQLHITEPPEDRMMRRMLTSVYRILVMFGIDLRATIHSTRGISHYIRNLLTLRRQKRDAVRTFPFGTLHPCLADRFSESGSAKGHYFHQDLLVARRIHLNKPKKHIDVGSRVDGFVAHVASFRPIVVIDIRPLPNNIPNVDFIQADLMAPVKKELIGSCDSLSCLHALEHFGLGRYGDPINFDGYLLGLTHLHQIVRQGGKFYLSVPIGPQRIEFDAHRVFSVDLLLELLSAKFNIDTFSYVDDQGDLHENTPVTKSHRHNSFGCLYGCGIFEMTKL